MRKIETIIIHCSDSGFGDAALIDGWHAKRWKASPSGKFIGYHYVVLNGRRVSSSTYVPGDDGVVEEGRPIAELGAHAVPWNKGSIGVCLIGKDGLYTVAQLLAASVLVDGLCKNHKVPLSKVFGHYQVPGTSKACPDFNIDHFRSLI